MSALTPSSSEELAEQLTSAYEARRTIELFGNRSKHLAAGPILESDVQISTRALNRILAHERNDLTISLEAGVPFERVQRFLQSYEQMLAIDPPFSDNATMGGVVATDLTGTLHRRFGSARDQVIGMTFATLDGRLIKAGGMVVKNVAGLDLAKLMIGSFGTLAAIVSVNLRVHSRPQRVQSFLSSFKSIESAIEKKESLLRSVLTPWAVELLSPPAAARLGRRGILLAVRAAGSPAVLDRYARELKPDEILGPEEDMAFWRFTSNFTSDFLARNPSGVVIRLISPLSELITIFKFASSPLICHAGSGMTDAYFNSWQSVPAIWQLAQQKEWEAMVTFAPAKIREDKELWLRSHAAGSSNSFDMMGRLKQMFDSRNLLNRLRLYGQL